MNLGIIKALLAFSLLSFQCRKGNHANNKNQDADLPPGTCFKGILVKRGICGQRVIQLVSHLSEGPAIQEHWTDTMSGKSYVNVFAVQNKCEFPSNIKESEAFSFYLADRIGNECGHCEAYTPVPQVQHMVNIGCN